MSGPEKQFLFYWVHALRFGFPLEVEYHFHPQRKWRFDFAHKETKVAIEIEGGTFRKSRHTTGTGFAADCEKYNEATRLDLNPDIDTFWIHYETLTGEKPKHLGNFFRCAC